MPIALLALASSAAWGAADFVAGLKTRTLGLLAVVLVSQSAGWVFAAALVIVAGNPVPGRKGVLFGVAAGVLGTCGLTALYKGLAIGKMGIVSPIAAMSGAIPVAVGLAHGERPRSLQLVGMALALIGVLLAAREPDGDGDQRRIAAGVGLALLAAVGLGAMFVCLDAAGDRDVAWAAFTLRSTALAILVVAGLVFRPSLRVGSRDAATLAGVGILDNGGNVLFALASSRGLLSLAAVMGSLYPVATATLARTVLHERISRVQLVGIVIAIGGVVLIAV